MRDYIHVTDLAQAHILAMEYLQQRRGEQHLQPGQRRGLHREGGHRHRTEGDRPSHPRGGTTPRRAGDPAQLVASSEKAKTVLGWKPQYDDLETIIASAWKWHESHPNGYGK